MKRNQRSTMKSALFFSIISISILLASSAQATLVPISDLPEGKLVVGDKLFSEFEVTSIVDGGPPELTAATIKVEGVEINDNYGLRFRVAMNAASDQTINANINFKVSILPDYEPWFLTDAVLWLPTAGATGDGMVTVNEMIYDAEYFGNLLADELDVSRELGDSGANLLADDDLMIGEELSPQKAIWVRMGIVVRGGYSPAVGTANLTEVFVLYSQIPEPATILMLGLGSLVLLRRRKR
ncbi:MAG: PEP-CTERM sorting domain-containing protein [Planctomycetota bacterium]